MVEGWSTRGLEYREIGVPGDWSTRGLEYQGVGVPGGLEYQGREEKYQCVVGGGGPGVENEGGELKYHGEGQ